MIQNLIDLGIRSVAIILSPDYSGGYNQEMVWSTDPDEDWWEGLGDFCYVEWQGRPIDLLKDDPWLKAHKKSITNKNK